MTTRPPETFAGLKPGDAIPPYRPAPVSRATLALYAGASCDHNPIHIDSDAAKAVGLPDVIAHGMLVMAWAGKAVADWAGAGRLRSFDVRFQAPTPPGAKLSCEGVVASVEGEGVARTARLDLRVVDAGGEVKLSGSATVAIG